MGFIWFTGMCTCVTNCSDRHTNDQKYTILDFFSSSRLWRLS